jgi:hypothetical protein
MPRRPAKRSNRRSASPGTARMICSVVRSSGTSNATTRVASWRSIASTALGAGTASSVSNRRWTTGRGPPAPAGPSRSLREGCLRPLRIPADRETTRGNDRQPFDKQARCRFAGDRLSIGVLRTRTVARRPSSSQDCNKDCWPSSLGAAIMHELYIRAGDVMDLFLPVIFGAFVAAGVFALGSYLMRSRSRPDLL